MHADQVLITGTTSGVGRALLDHYAKMGKHVISVNRRRCPALESRYPSMQFELVDVRAAGQVTRLVERLAQTGTLPRVFILNAGINRIDNDAEFELQAYQDVMNTNLYGVLSFVEPLTRQPASSRPLHVVAISSMANYVGNPYGLGYHTSKRALTACFDVWSNMYTGTDLVFQQVMLGPVQTDIYSMEHRLPWWMARTKHAFSVSAQAAAQAIAAFVTTRRKRLFYPRLAVPLYLGMGLSQRVLPGFFRGRETLDGKARRGRPSPGNDETD